MGIIMVYDITDRQSFNAVDEWIKSIYEHTDDIVLILVGNKTDMADSRKISYDEGLQLAQKYKMGFLETSAKDNSNVKEAFMRIGSEIKANDKILSKNNEN